MDTIDLRAGDPSGNLPSTTTTTDADLAAELQSLRAQLAALQAPAKARRRSPTAREIRARSRQGGSMKGIKLSKATIDALEPPAAGETFAWSADLPGFGVRVSASGRRSTIVQFRIRGSGRSQRHTIGDIRVVPLSIAEKRAQAILWHAKEGRDLLAEEAAEKQRRRDDKEHAEQRGVGTIVTAYLADPATRRRRSFGETERYLRVVWKAVHAESAETIDRDRLAHVLEGIAIDRGEVTANRARSALSALFIWALTRGWPDPADPTGQRRLRLRREANPTQFLHKWAEQSRERVLSLAELGTVWRVAPDVNPGVGAIVRLLMLTGCRKSEIAELRWSEIDLEAAEIRLSSSRTKNGRPHVVPLAPAAVAVLEECPRTSSPLVFTGISGWTWYMTRLRKAAALAQPWTLHDLRRSCATGLREQPITADVHLVELVINHAGGSRGGVAGTYDRSERLAERRRVLERWSSLILAAAGEPVEASTVVNLR